jgi:predicted secreted hydrolase
MNDARRGASGTRSLIAVVALAGAGLLAFALQSTSPRTARVIRATLSLADALGTGDTAGYARAFGPRPFTFPQDHGAHPDFRTEWWYFTGNLETADGRRFGYQLTFFRSALAPAALDRASAWATRQAWMAHFALTDTRPGEFHAFDRFARGAQGLAGATTAPFRVWVDDWSVESDADDDDVFPIRLRAADGAVSIDLTTGTGKPIVLQGELGFSRKGPEPGNASFYYSFTRMPTTGTLRIGGRTHAVHGSSWLDREWSTSGLRESLAGWDWFALQFEDRSELMIYQLRRNDGTTDPFSGGSFVATDGSTMAIDAADVMIEATASWSSPIDGTLYPSAWRIRVPALGLAVDLVPLLANQELDLAVRYWEGAVEVRGTRDGTPVRGHGYAELTGYAGSAGARAVPNAR